MVVTLTTLITMIRVARHDNKLYLWTQIKTTLFPLIGGMKRDPYSIIYNYLWLEEGQLAEFLQKIKEKSNDKCKKVVNSTKWGYHTPLILSAAMGMEKHISCLLEYGADINIRDTFGWTALFWAVYNRNMKMIKILISNGIDLEIEDMNGNTALDVAKNMNYEEGVKILYSHSKS